MLMAALLIFLLLGFHFQISESSEILSGKYEKESQPVLAYKVNMKVSHDQNDNLRARLEGNVIFHFQALGSIPNGFSMIQAGGLCTAVPCCNAFDFANGTYG